jgi:hypothetical protein
MNKAILGVIIILIVFGGVFFITRKPTSNTGPKPTPTPVMVEQLPADKAPQISLEFSKDGHYVTVNISNLNASQLEYNIIYDATVKKNQINTGVSGGARDLAGKSEYTYKQLLGSESSGKFTYHENIKNAVMEVTLRNSAGYSVFTSSYPFEVKAGKTIDLKASE